MRSSRALVLPIDLWNAGPPVSGSSDFFLPTEIEHIPEAAKRYLFWSTPVGAPIPKCARFFTAGRIRPFRGHDWVPMTARETIQCGVAYSIESYAGRSQDLTGYDYYVSRRGERRWVNMSKAQRQSYHEHGADFDEFARWRVAATRMLIPGGLLPGPLVRWTDGDENGASFAVIVEGKRYHFHLTIAADGRPCKLTSKRWDKFHSVDEQWQLAPYTIRFSGVYHKDGYTLPHQFTSSWGEDLTEEYAVVEMEIQDAEFQ